MRAHAEQQAEPRRGNRFAGGCRLGSCKSKEGRELVWDAKQSHRERGLRGGAGIANQALVPGQAKVSALRTSEDERR